MTDDESVLYYTGLPNVKVLKAIFKHVLKTMPFEGINKLTPYQEFMCTLQKLRSNTGSSLSVWCIQGYSRLLYQELFQGS